ncbi:retrovirus-related Pol polyprotein from type-2 retrotransposable element R2DM [Trichonephila clavipes]|uniref:Retrovirus-related Pol polyprotein from type-2 retrotransposable element R2DM n=1 Tax=Trichonephila clavipes TaxID=2585209 RepID=A0A8X6VRR1_TRICX|nr:retrovirus-related Pol polyprotein from type-2 retrotransposable element R2DM [Trichonephila clavipes]
MRGQPPSPIALRSGVKQGCPLSGILFNIAIDQVLRSVQEHKGYRAILAFADDLVLLEETADELQEMIQLTSDELSLLCLQLNPVKCATNHLAGTATPIEAAPTQLNLNGIAIRTLADGEYYSYFGKQVGFYLQKTFGSVNEALLLLQKIATSNLAPWQKIDSLKAFFFSSLSFAMRTAQIDKTTCVQRGLCCQERA